MWSGLLPLILLVMVVALFVALTALARFLAMPLGFLTWQPIAIGVWVAGFVCAVIVYALVTRRTLRQVGVWRDMGLNQQAVTALWTLLIAAVIVLVPVILALALPQHPAP